MCGLEEEAVICVSQLELVRISELAYLPSWSRLNIRYRIHSSQRMTKKAGSYCFVRARYRLTSRVDLTVVLDHLPSNNLFLYSYLLSFFESTIPICSGPRLTPLCRSWRIRVGFGIFFLTKARKWLQDDIVVGDSEIDHSESKLHDCANAIFMSP